jgi:hypothetical protein
MPRKIFWAVLVIGVVRVVAPFALGMPSKAKAGQAMMDGFRPIMEPANVEKTAAYYNDVFVPLGKVAPAINRDSATKFQGYVGGFTAMGVEAQKLVPALAQAMNMPVDQVQGFMAANFPAMSSLLQNLPAMQQDFTDLIGLMAANVGIFGEVPAGLAHYKPLVTTMHANVDAYDKADSLPDMRLFTWFFVVPGALLIGLAALGLYSTRPSVRFEATVPRPAPVEHTPVAH